MADENPLGRFVTFVDEDGFVASEFRCVSVESRIEHGVRHHDGTEHFNPWTTPADVARAIEADPELTAVQRTVYYGPTVEVS